MILMKQTILAITGLLLLTGATAQNITPENDFVPQSNGFPVVDIAHGNRFFSRICIDVNSMAGTVNQKITSSNPAANYADPLNTRISGLKISNGFSHSTDAEIGYYFDMAGRYGVGTGLMFTQQNSNLTLDDFHIEYKSTDNFNNVFRQLLTSDGQIKEKLTSNTFNIPLLFKYKFKITEWIGFNADAGLLFNISENIHYKTNASFDYEAIYDYSGPQGSVVPIYDNSAGPAAGDLLLTKSQYLSSNSASGIQSYFNTLKAEGYNVGLGVSPNNKKGVVSDISGSVGFLVRPSVNIVLSHAISVNAGVYYMMQNFNHNAPSGYQLTNKLGQYDPLVNTVSHGVDNSYGITIGASYSFRRIHHMAVIVPADDTSSIPEEEEKNEDSPSPVQKMRGNFSYNTPAPLLPAPALNEPEIAEQAIIIDDKRHQ